MTLREFKQHKGEYYVLFLVLLVELVAILGFSYNIQTQKWVVYLMGVTYFVWSIIYHYRRRNLQVSIVVEYLVFILFGILLLSFGLV